jgi:hypothetical protein
MYVTCIVVSELELSAHFSDMDARRVDRTLANEKKEKKSCAPGEALHIQQTLTPNLLVTTELHSSLSSAMDYRWRHQWQAKE